jgi:hypothetical protein
MPSKNPLSGNDREITVGTGMDRLHIRGGVGIFSARMHVVCVAACAARESE